MSTPTFETLAFDLAGGVATITLNRPDAANGMNMDLARELMQAAIFCEETDEVRAVLLTGNGKMFSAGGDLKSFAEYGEQLPAAIRELTVYLHAAVARFAHMPAPVIIAVNGTAAGAGFSLAVSGDMVLSAKSAKFTMAYTGAGLSPDGSASYYLPRLIGLRKTQELMLTNRVLSADEAYDWGLINQVCNDEELLAEATNLANRLAKGPTVAYGQVKKLLNSSFNNGLETQLELESQGIASMASSVDGREGIAAFLGKRRPEFSGQ